MSQIPNPNQSQPFDRVLRDISGQKVWGIRNEHSSNEEIVHIPTGKSNQEYFIPDVVMQPEGCNHSFYFVTNREITCQNHGCGLTIGIHVARNYKEIEGKPYVTVNKNDLPIQSSL